jgi:RNA polymerase sigma-70 factor (ECF subfamily)
LIAFWKRFTDHPAMSHDHETPASEQRAGNARFTTTHWSVVLAAGSAEKAQLALERLCRTYWYPLYAYLRRCGYAAHDAEDLVQGFFCRVLESQGFRNATPERGRFRSFLLAALSHFVSNEWKREHRIKRGGGFVFIPIQTDSAEKRYGAEPAHELTPEKIFNRRWALTVIEQSLAQIRKEYASGGKVDLFEELKIYITGEQGTPAYAELALRLSMSEDALKMAVSRLRKKYREVIRAEIAQTLDNNADIEDELHELLQALG